MALNYSKKALIQDYEVPETDQIIVSLNETSESVNKLLEKERVVYLKNQDGIRIDIPDNKYAFYIDAIEIETQDGETLIIPFRLEKDNLNDILKENNTKEHKSTKVIGIVDRNKVKTQKPENEEYYKVDKGDYREYILKEDLDEIIKNSKIRDMNLMELTSLKELSEEEQLKFLEKYFKDFDLENESFINKIDELFDYAKERFKERTGKLQETKTFKNLDNSELKTKDDILNLLNNASSGGKNRRDTTIYCTILKFMYLYNEMKKNPIFELLDKINIGEIKVESILKDIFNLKENIKIEKSNKGIYTFNNEIDGNEVTITFRVKNIKSIMKKALAKGEYLKLENFRDIFGMSIYIQDKDKKNVVNIMKKLDIQFFNRKGYVKNKGLITEEDVKNIDLNINPEDKKYLYSAKKNDKNKGSSVNYSDCKIIGKGHFEWNPKRTYLPKEGINLGVEIKFLFGEVTEDKNEKGMSFHPIYEYFAKFFEGEKNRQPFIPVELLINHIDSLYSDILINEDLLEKYGKTKIDIIGDLYEELSTKKLPINSSNTSLKRLFNSEISKLIFLHLKEKYKFQVSSLRNGNSSEIVITTEENREQIEDGGRGYRFIEKK